MYFLFVQQSHNVATRVHVCWRRSACSLRLSVYNDNKLLLLLPSRKTTMNLAKNVTYTRWGRGNGRSAWLVFGVRWSLAAEDLKVCRETYVHQTLTLYIHGTCGAFQCCKQTDVMYIIASTTIDKVCNRTWLNLSLDMISWMIRKGIQITRIILPFQCFPQEGCKYPKCNATLDIAIRQPFRLKEFSHSLRTENIHVPLWNNHLFKKMNFEFRLNFPS